MFHIKEYDEDPTLQQSDNNDEDNNNNALLAVNTSIPRREYKVDLSTTPTITTHNVRTTQQSSWHALVHTPKQVLVDLFLPLGFPHSVDSSYLSYQFYDSLQGLCSYLRGVVSTSAVLTAAGVGDSEATAMGAAMTWALKDGMGMLGGLAFSYVASPHFDAYVLEFRLFADLINDVALTLDMMAPLVPSSCLLWLMSASTLSKTMCGMSAGATKSSITCHLALEGNMADLNAKEGTQETLVSLVGMMLGVQLAKQLERLQQTYEDRPLTLSTTTLPTDWQTVSVQAAVSWAIFLFLTWLHMWANYRGVKLIKLKSLNRERATAALDGIVSKMAANYWEIPEAPSQVDTSTTVLPGPDDIEESMVRATYTLLFPQRQSVALGVPILSILQASANNNNPEALVQEFHNERYILGIHHYNQSKNHQVRTTLRTGSNNIDELKAFVHSLLLRKCLDSPPKNSSNLVSKPEDIATLIQITHKQLDALFGTDDDSSSDCLLLKKLAEKGWDVDARLYLGFGRQRTSWESSKTE